MATTSLSNALAQQALDALAQWGSETKAGLALNIPSKTLHSRVTVAKLRGLTVSPGIHDPNNLAHLKIQIDKLEHELTAEQNKALTHTLIKSKIIGLTKNVTEVETPDWLLDPRRSISAPGTPTLLCSDWHVGEVVDPKQIGGVNKYNMAIFRERVRVLIESAVKLLRIISPKMDYPGIVIPLAGDMISGNIHDELVATNELNTMPTVLELYGVLGWMIDQFLEHFQRIFIPCVTGNHGRDTKKIWAKDRHHTSFDWLLYCFLAKRYEGNKRVTFLIPDGPDAYFRIYSHRYLETHLDQFRGGDGMIGALGPIIRGDHKKRSRNAQIGMEYDTMFGGHWHQYINLTRLIVNGSLKGYDEFAYRENYPYESPQQALWLTHPKYGITYRMPVYVDSKLRVTQKLPWVSI